MYIFKLYLNKHYIKIENFMNFDKILTSKDCKNKLIN